MANTKVPARLLDTSAIPALNVTGDLTVDTTTLKVDSTNNRVGIGTPSPDTPLTVSVADNTIATRFKGTNGIFRVLPFETGLGVKVTALNGNESAFETLAYQGADHQFVIGTAEKMRIDSSGNVGIGTDNPSAPLHIDAAGMGDVYSGLIQNSTTDTDHYNVVKFIQGASGSAIGLIGTGGSATGNTAFRNSFVVGTQSSSPLVFATNDTERMRIDSSGNVGIGTSSITNNTLGKTTYFGNSTSSITGDSSSARFWLGNNWYFNSGDKFIGTGYANLYSQQSGNHEFLTSTASGTAGAAATFTSVLKIDSSGNVTSGGDLHFGGSNQGRVKTNSNSVYVDAIPTNSHIIFRNDGSVEKMHITDTGSLYHVEQGSDGDYTSYIGSISNSGSGARYAHVNIYLEGGDMFWIEVIGYDYSNGSGLVYGRSGGYIYLYTTSTTVYSGHVNGSIVAHYQLTNGSYEVVVDTNRSDTDNRWGSMVFRGGTDTITGSHPLEIIQYSYTGSTSKVY